MLNWTKVLIKSLYHVPYSVLTQRTTNINAIPHNIKEDSRKIQGIKKPYYGVLPRERSERSEPERLRSLFERLRFRSLDLDLEESEESDSELEVELDESLLELDSDSESESDVESERLAFLRGGVSLLFPLSSFDRSFSFASKILFAVPIGFLNSSGTSTEGFPSALSFASNFGFSSC
jgi:hypothetical protein